MRSSSSTSAKVTGHGAFGKMGFGSCICHPCRCITTTSGSPKAVSRSSIYSSDRNHAGTQRTRSDISENMEPQDTAPEAQPSASLTSLPPSRQSFMRHTRIVLIVFVCAGLAGGFFVGTQYTERKFASERDSIITEVTNTESGKPTAAELSPFWQVWDRLHERYVDSDRLSAEALVYGA